MKLEDVFVDPAKARKKLGQIAAKRISADPEAERSEDNDLFYVSLETIEAIRKGDREMLENFQLVPGRIVFIFGAYRSNGEFVEIGLKQIPDIEVKQG